MGENVKRPYKYRLGQRRTLDFFFKSGDIVKSLSILDVGCGIGTGMLHFKSLGFFDITGIDTDPCRIELAKRRELNAYRLDANDIPKLGRKFDIIWASHSLEHMKEPSKILEILKDNTTLGALFYFILPYPDLQPAEVHYGSKEIGLHINDKGRTVRRWFQEQGFDVSPTIFSQFREPEIWLEMRKSK